MFIASEIKFMVREVDLTKDTREKGLTNKRIAKPPSSLATGGGGEICHCLLPCTTQPPNSCFHIYNQTKKIAHSVVTNL